MRGGSIYVGFDDLELPLTRVSRSPLYTYKSNISQMVRYFWIIKCTITRDSTENVQKMRVVDKKKFASMGGIFLDRWWKYSNSFTRRWNWYADT